MQLCKVQLETGEVRVGALEDGHVRLLGLEGYAGLHSLSDVLHAPDPAGTARELMDEAAPTVALTDLTVLAPLDRLMGDTLLGVATYRSLRFIASSGGTGGTGNVAP